MRSLCRRELSLAFEINYHSNIFQWKSISRRTKHFIWSYRFPAEILGAGDCSFAWSECSVSNEIQWFLLSAKWLECFTSKIKFENRDFYIRFPIIRTSIELHCSIVDRMVFFPQCSDSLNSFYLTVSLFFFLLPKQRDRKTMDEIRHCQ